MNVDEKNKLVTIKKRRDFLKIASKGKSFIRPCYILQFLPKENITNNNISRLVGYTASKKVGKAVNRNKAKRRMRALAQKLIKDNASPNYAYVIIARKAILEESFDNLKQDLTFSLKKTNLWMN